jgi:hypothetical protein
MDHSLMGAIDMIVIDEHRDRARLRGSSEALEAAGGVEHQLIFNLPRPN